MATYLVLNENSIVINMIEYDGVSPYDPGNNNSLIIFDESIKPSYGWSYTGGVWEAPEVIIDESVVARSSAIEKLSALGLTQTEIDSLMGV